MSRFEYKHNGREVSMIATGSLEEVVAEIGYMVQRIHNGIKTQSPEDAVLFRLAMQSIMENDSPTWDDLNAQDGEIMIAMVTEQDKE